MLKFFKRVITEVPPDLLRTFLWNFCYKGRGAVKAFEKRKKQGKHFPAFMVISLTNTCNLSCKGCWVTQTPRVEIAPEQLDELICQCKKNGSYFFGLLGGEPLLYKDLFTVIAKHPDCYFQIFTNGTLLTREVAQKMRALKNVTPLISIEGDAVISDVRRGGKNVYERSLKALDHCAAERLITGVCTSVCKNNIDTLATKPFLDELIKRKVHYVWYYIYRPVGPHPNRDLALSQEEITRLRRFIVERRCTEAIAIVDAYWDAKGHGLCPAATGFSHHINSCGDIELCPPLQFSMDSVRGEAHRLEERLENSSFLERFRRFIANETQGCILLNNPEKLKAFLEAEAARDSSGRGCAYAELGKMSPCPCHHNPELAIPEKSFWYKWAKRFYFFGFGAYG